MYEFIIISSDTGEASNILENTETTESTGNTEVYIYIN